MGATDIDRLLVCFQDCLHQFSSCLRTPIFGAVVHIWRRKCRQKMVFFLVSLDISARLSRILKLFGHAYMHYCSTVSASHFQVLIRSGWWDSTNLFPLLGWSSSEANFLPSVQVPDLEILKISLFSLFFPDFVFKIQENQGESFSIVTPLRAL